MITELRGDLGDRLATFRKAAGMTQAQLATAAYCDRTRIAHLEKGRGAADERFWRTLDELLSADGLLVKAEQDVRLAQREQEGMQRRIGLAVIRGRIDGWRHEGLNHGVDAEMSGVTAAGLQDAMEWLDARCGWPVGTSRQRVAAYLRERAQLTTARGSVARSRIASALSRYYGTESSGVGTLTVRVGAAELPTTVMCRPEWVGLGCELTVGRDRMALRAEAPTLPPIDEHVATAAVRRLGEAAAGRVRLANVPLYRLLDIAPSTQAMSGTFALGTFIEYALTMDLLEGELVDAISAGTRALPLRDAHLPNVESVLDVGGRLCAGGALALFAIARPADPDRGPADYLILVQRRSGTVLNAAGKLSVTPKGFHGPLVDYRADVRIGATLMRELEEELFGRVDVDSTEGPQRAAAPMHPTRLSEPMRWLTDQPGRMRTECTGFGLNLVSGNYEFASLIVVEDEEFWPRFGGAVVANWESDGLRQYSTLDGDLLAELAADESWSNEGLFAFVLGLERLGDADGARVRAPAIGWVLR